MDFGDSLSADLPAPRDDEPAGLRQDILDELADHLACSYNRELLRGTNPGEARRRAIERFGDPAAVARRLWLDAMRGKIMAQRVLIATCLVVVAACLGLTGLIWSQSSRAAAEAAEANRRLAELLGQTQATNQEMLRQLQAMAQPAQPSKSADWIPVKFQLTVEKPDGPPAVGYQVILGRGHGGTEKPEAIHRSSDTNGLADFGVVQPGDWEFTIRAGPWHTSGGLNAIPGTSILKEVACPKSPPDRARVKVRMDWPKPLADKDLVAIASFDLEEQTYQPPLVWGVMNHETPDLQLVGRTRGGLTRLFQDLVLTPNKPDPTEESDNVVFSPGYADSLLAQGRLRSIIPPETSTPVEGPFELTAGRYSLDRLLLFRALPDHPGGKPVECELLSLMSRNGQRLQVLVRGAGRGGMMGHMVFLYGRHRGLSSSDQEYHFEARPGGTAEWVIHLPEDMIREAEKRLKVEAPSGKTG